MLVDDEPELLAALRRTFTVHGFDCVTAASAREALAILAGTSIQVIVSDIDMPQMDGLELLAQARLMSPRTVRIVLTGKNSTEVAVRAINEGAVHHFMLKPFDPAELRAVVDDALTHHQSITRAEDTLQRERARRDRRRVVESACPGLFEVTRDGDGTYVVDCARAEVGAVQVGLQHLLDD